MSEKQYTIDKILHWINATKNDSAITVSSDDLYDYRRIAKAVEEKRGSWIKMSDADGIYYNCESCGNELPRYTIQKPTYERPFPQKYSIDKTYYCPNCGAMMEVEE